MPGTRRPPNGPAGTAEPLLPNPPAPPGEGGEGVRVDPASGTREARERALALRGLRCPDCGSYEVVPKLDRVGDSLCCQCARVGGFLGWVRLHR